MATDFRKRPEQILVDLINESNGTVLGESDITFNVPMAIANATRNTAITVTAVPSSRYSGSRDLTYDRVLVSQVTEDFKEIFNIDGITTIYDLIPTLNSTYKVNFTESDIEDGELPITTTEEPMADGVFTLRAKPGSLVYRGEAQVRYVAGLPNNLGAFHHFLHQTLPRDIFA